MGVMDALEQGPKHLLGEITLSPGKWQPFAFGYNSPRDARGYKSTRVLFEFSTEEKSASADSVVFLDDIAHIEWLTPFMSSDDTSTIRCTESCFAY